MVERTRERAKESVMSLLSAREEEIAEEEEEAADEDEMLELALSAARNKAKAGGKGKAAQKPKARR